jgi:hypothetical protein
MTNNILEKNKFYDTCYHCDKGYHEGRECHYCNGTGKVKSPLKDVLHYGIDNSFLKDYLLMLSEEIKELRQEVAKLRKLNINE